MRPEGTDDLAPSVRFTPKVLHYKFHQTMRGKFFPQIDKAELIHQSQVSII
jgi:hypothetical protein